MERAVRIVRSAVDVGSAVGQIIGGRNELEGRRDSAPFDGAVT